MHDILTLAYIIVGTIVLLTVLYVAVFVWFVRKMKMPW